FAGSVPSNPFGGDALIHRRGGTHLHHYASDGGATRYAEVASTYRLDALPGARRSVDWAAFAYAGVRPVSEVHITAIQEPKTSPFETSLSFLQTADTNLLANWIVSQNYRRLKAKEAGDVEQADQLALGVRRIEEVIATIIEDPSFGFVITARDD